MTRCKAYPFVLKPNNKLAEALTPDGHQMTLYEHDGHFFIRLDGQELMHSLAYSSEILLGEIGVEAIWNVDKPRILIGGLGLGFSLKSLLSGLPKKATVHISELMPEVIDWNRKHMSELNGKLLDDPRVNVFVEDVCDRISDSRNEPYDVILLDVDNGPSSMVQKDNDRLYSQRGIKRIDAALTEKGRVAIWAASEDRFFTQRLSKTGMKVDLVPAKVHPNAKRCAYIIYVADKKVQKKKKHFF